jgi:hypothetical protein
MTVEKSEEAIMTNYEENERALKELFQDVKSVRGTFPPVYNCGDAIIGYNREGQTKVMASTKVTSPLQTQDGWLKRWQARLKPLTGTSGTEQNLIDSWIQRWRSRHWRQDEHTKTAPHKQLRHT